MLNIGSLPGLVITPACDLQNNKSDSITYLPIIPVRQAFSQRCFLPDVIRALDGLLEQLKQDAVGDIAEKFVPLEPDVLQAMRDALQVPMGSPKKDIEAAARARAGFTVLQLAFGTDTEAPKGDDLRQLFGASGFAKIAERTVTNAFKTDLHFLPSDQEPVEWTVIKEPSVVLFRYPLSAPIEIFDRAQDTTRPDWKAEIKKLARCIPGAQHFVDHRPMKRLTLKPRFFADLLTRYISMHVRLGSPDFTEESVKAYVVEISKV